GWDASTGYVVPTTIDPGLGYWVRLDPGASLKMQTSGFTGGLVSKTAYQRLSEEITLAGYLTVSSNDGTLQALYLSAEPMDAEATDILQLPFRPPTGLPDIRTELGTRYAVPGTNEILIQGNGEITLAFHGVPGAIIRCTLFDSQGEILYEYSEGSNQALTLNVRNGVRLRLQYSARVPEALRFALNQNFPNPFRVSSGTNIPYELEYQGFTEIEIHDILGRKVRTLISLNASTGKHSVYWDGRNDVGQPVLPGLYVVQLTSGTKSQSMILSVVK
ncbi:MAG: T9SS type A sorting domain-containing protein, partial [Chlorobi bacterium]|nr:T9SS type A sorting domain-containing protein [Chlorobiota bacterium]